MRRQDELLIVYTGQPLNARKFLISQSESLSLAFDSEQVLRFLQDLAGDPDPTIRHQAVHSLLRFLLGFVEKRYALKELQGTPWSAVEVGLGDIRRMALGLAGEDPRDAAVLRAWTVEARPLTRALLERATGPASSLRTAALLALGLLPDPDVAGRLDRMARTVPSDFEVQLAAIRQADGDRVAGAWLKRIRALGKDHPDLLLLVPELGSTRGAEVLAQLAPRVESAGRINLALAAAELDGLDPTRTLHPLLADRDPWVTVFCLQTVERLRDERLVPVLRAIARARGSESIRTHAVRAAGFVPGSAIRDLCLEALGDPSDKVRGQALESLIRIGVPASDLMEHARRLQRSPSLKARVHAALVASLAGDTLAVEILRGMLLGQNPMERLEAAFCLGYVRAPSHVTYLTILAGRDPSRPVRLQAVKSLCRYPADLAFRPLVDLVADDDPGVAAAASQGLARYRDREARVVWQGLVERLASGPCATGRSGALVRQTLGNLSRWVEAHEAVGVLGSLLETGDSALLAGTLEGLKAYPGDLPGPVLDLLRGLAGHEDGRLAARAALLLHLAGQPGTVEVLLRLLTAGSEDDARASVSAILELSCLLTRPGVAGRVGRLTSRVESDSPINRPRPVPFRVPASEESAEAEASVYDAPDRDRAWAVGHRRDGASTDVPTLQSGEIRLPPAAAKPPPRRGVADATPARAPGLTRAQLLAHLESPRVRESAASLPLKDWLLVAHHSVRASLGERLLRIRSRAHWLLLALALVPLAALPFLARSPDPEQSLLDRLPPSVSVYLAHVRGLTELDPPRRLAEAGDPIGPGTSLQTGADARAGIGERSGARIELGPSSRLTVDQAGTGSATRATLVRGSFDFDYAAGGEIDVTAGLHRIEGRGVRFSLESSGDSWRLEVRTGSPSLTRSGQPPEDLLPGTRRALR